MDYIAFAKTAGLTENDIKGKTVKQIIKLAAKKANENADKDELEEAKPYFSNYEKLLPRFKESIEKPFELYVKTVGQKKTPSIVPVIGYNSIGKEKGIVVFFNEKYYTISENNIIKSIEELAPLLKKSKGTKNK